MKMSDCRDNEVKVCKLVEALRGKALDYFESLPKELRLEFDSLCSMFEGRFGRQEAPATMRSKLKCITQRVEESLAEFGERALKVASEGYVGMTGQWVQALAVDAFLMGCLDKRSALSSMNKEPQTMDEAVKLMRRLGSHSRAMSAEKQSFTLEEGDGASAPLQVDPMVESESVDVDQLNFFYKEDFIKKTSKTLNYHYLHNIHNPPPHRIQTLHKMIDITLYNRKGVKSIKTLTKLLAKMPHCYHSRV